MNCLEGQYKDLEQDLLIDGKPVQLSEYESDVIRLLGMRDDIGSSI